MRTLLFVAIATAVSMSGYAFDLIDATFENKKLCIRIASGNSAYVSDHKDRWMASCVFHTRAITSKDYTKFGLAGDDKRYDMHVSFWCIEKEFKALIAKDRQSLRLKDDDVLSNSNKKGARSCQ